MKNKTVLKSLVKKSFALITAVILVLSLFALAGCSEQKVDESQKTVTFKVVYEDGSEKVYELNTQKGILAEALVEKGLITYEKSGMYTTIDGVTADYDKDGSWWCITKGGEMLNSGLNDTLIVNGETYEATYTK